VNRAALLAVGLAALACTTPRVVAPKPEAAGPSADAIYFVLVDRFANGDRANDGAIDPADPSAFHGGDLQGVIDHLDDLKALGIRTVWLSPVFKMRTEKFFGYGAFHGYWTYDLSQVEPRFGTDAQLRKLSDELHKRGMRLLLDLVVNHVGPDAPLLKERPEWFHGKGPLKNWDDPEELTTHDVHGLPDLAQEREEVYRFLMDATLRWVREVRPDGFRLDAVKHVPLSFWARFNGELHSASPGLFLLGEMLDGDPALLAKVGAQGKFDAMFDFPLGFALVDVFCKDQAPARLGAVFSSDRLYADPDSLVTLLDNHDLPRVMSQCGGDVERVRQALTVMLTARGTPSLLYGTESGLTGAKEPENRGDMQFEGNAVLRSTIASLLELRKQHPALVQGVPLTLEAEPGLFAYARVTPGEVAVISVNRRKEPVTLRLPADLASGVEWVEPAAAPLTVAPGSVLVAFGRPAAPNGFAALHRRAVSQRAGEPKRKLELSLQGAPVGAAEEIYLVGSSPEAGAWNADHALGPFSADGRLTALLPIGTVLEFKFVVRAKGAKPRWEDGDNRLLLVEPGDGPRVLKAAWGRR
jgi:glycosidase